MVEGSKSSANLPDHDVRAASGRWYGEIYIYEAVSIRRACFGCIKVCIGRREGGTCVV